MITKALEIVLDIDGPLCLENGRISNFFAFMTRQGEKCCYYRFLETGSWHDAIEGYDRTRINVLWLEFSATIAGEIKPTPGAVRALAQLRSHRRHLATARAEQQKSETVMWLAKHFDPFHEEHFGLDDKSTVIRALNADVFIEDTPGVALRVAKATVNTLVILFPSTGCREVPCDHPHIRRLQAEALLPNDKCPLQYAKMCQKAWQEIVTIIEYEVVSSRALQLA